MIRTGAAFALACTLLCGCASFREPSLKENDTIVFLGDSITQAGVKPGGYVTLTSQAIAKAYPDLNVSVIGAGGDLSPRILHYKKAQERRMQATAYGRA